MKDKILNLLILSLILVIALQYFWDTNQKEKQSGELVVTSTDDAYAIPASVGLIFTNNSTWSVSIYPCRDISLNFQWKVTPLDGETICKDFNVSSWESHTLDLWAMYSSLETPGAYIFEVHYGEKKYIIPVDIGHRWTLGKLFVGVFYAPIYNLMVFLLQTFSHSLGWAIIAVTIIIRVILIWPQHRMMVSQKKLQNIQPKIKELQEKHKWNSQLLGMELMKLYKEEKVNPMGSCWLLLIQLPVLLVIYNVITSIQNTAHIYYLYPIFSNFRVEDISEMFYGIDLFSVWGTAGVILWITVWLIQYIQVKLSLDSQGKTQKKWLVLEKKPGDSDYNSLMPDPEFMNKFMLYGMPAMVVVFTYSLFLWVGVYWGVSTLFSIFQQIIVNKIVKK